MRTFFWASLCLFFAVFGTSFAQQPVSDLALANEYYSSGEYEKAIDLYEKLLKNKNYILAVHENYFDALQKTEKYEQAEKHIKRLIKDKPTLYYLQVDYAMLLKRMKKNAESEKVLNEMSEKIKGDANAVRYVLNDLLGNGLYDFAEKLLLDAQSDNKNNFILDLANVYSFQGKTEKMLDAYLDFIDFEEDNLDIVLNTLPYKLTSTEDLERLEPLVFKRVQKSPEKIAFAELLVWYYLQRQEFFNAFTQAKAIDKRKKLEGNKIFEIGISAFNNKDFKASAKIFDYLVEKYPDSPGFYNYKLFAMKSKEELIKSTYPLDIEQVKSLIKDYQDNIAKYGINLRTIEIARNMALLQAFYLGERDSSVIILEKVVALGKQNPRLVSKAKLDLGDIYLLKNEWWEATLLYSQVEKTEKEADLGHAAKLKNAKLSYYRGDFQLAKEHLDILKLATSREISNDAMSLSILITENTGLDTSETALQTYADADLLIFQQQNEKAEKVYVEMLEKYKKHTLEDDILWQLGNLSMKSGRHDAAVKFFERILNEFPTDVHGDNANFMLGVIYDEYLKNKEKAMFYYQEQLVKFPGSIFNVEARKRFRALRGDSNTPN